MAALLGDNSSIAYRCTIWALLTPSCSDKAQKDNVWFGCLKWMALSWRFQLILLGGVWRFRLQMPDWHRPGLEVVKSKKRIQGKLVEDGLKAFRYSSGITFLGIIDCGGDDTKTRSAPVAVWIVRLNLIIKTILPHTMSQSSARTSSYPSPISLSASVFYAHPTSALTWVWTSYWQNNLIPGSF